MPPDSMGRGQGSSALKTLPELGTLWPSSLPFRSLSADLVPIRMPLPLSHPSVLFWVFRPQFPTFLICSQQHWKWHLLSFLLCARSLRISPLYACNTTRQTLLLSLLCRQGSCGSKEESFAQGHRSYSVARPAGFTPVPFRAQHRLQHRNSLPLLSFSVTPVPSVPRRNLILPRSTTLSINIC